MTDLRDARLRRALEHAPDDEPPPAALRAAIGARARQAVGGDRPAAPARAPWWHLWGRGGTDPAPRMPWNAAFATVLVAGFVTVLWQGQPVPDGRPEATAPARPAEPAPPAAVAQRAPTADSKAANPEPFPAGVPPVADASRAAPSAVAAPQAPPAPQGTVPGRPTAEPRKEAASPARRREAVTESSPSRDRVPPDAGPAAVQPAQAPQPTQPAAPPAMAQARSQLQRQAGTAEAERRDQQGAEKSAAADAARPSAAPAAVPLPPPPMPAAAPAPAPAPAAAPAPAPAPAAAPLPATAPAAAPSPAPSLPSLSGRAAAPGALASPQARAADSAAPPDSAARGSAAFGALRAQASWERWTEARITQQGRTVAVARAQAETLAAWLRRAAAATTGGEPMAQAAVVRIELWAGTEPVAVFELAPDALRWAELRAGGARLHGGALDAAQWQALLADIQRLMSAPR